MLGIQPQTLKSPDILVRDESLVLGIDLQERLMPAMLDAAATESAAVKLMQGAALLGVPVLITEQYPKGLGHTISAVQAALPAGAGVFEKTSFSVLGCPSAMTALAAAKRKRIVVLGVESHVCVLQSVLDLLAQGAGWVYVVADAVSSRRASDRDAALARMRAAGAHVVSSEMVLFEWLGAAGTPEFKAISQLVK